MQRETQSVEPDIVVAVSRLANYVGRLLDRDRKLKRLGVSGEISGYAPQPNGTVYFDLKDRDALIKCVAWSEVAATLPLLANGQAVVATGSVGTYPKKSTYQLTVLAVVHEGAGRLHAVYEALKRRLELEGLFHHSRKRPLPKYPFAIGLVSSRTANGAEDFLIVAASLAPHVKIELFETLVQGPSAAAEIVRAIDRASRSTVDLVVVARGGGSYEDLFAFNDESVVRALARCAHPTVSAIGHEADAPLTDFVADMRAHTPSSAAQTILPRRTDVLRSLRVSTDALDRCIVRSIDRLADDLARIEIRSPLASPQRMLQPRRQAVDTAAMDVKRAVERRLRVRREAVAALGVRLEACNPSVRLSLRRERLGVAGVKLESAARAALVRHVRRYDAAARQVAPAAHAALARRRTALQLAHALLDARDPTAILQRGYAIVTVNGTTVRDAASVPVGARVVARVARGTLTARVEAVDGDGGK